MTAQVAIVDYGLGNLFSVRRACEVSGLTATVTSDRAEIDDAAAVVLPGVGAFGDAMTALDRLRLVDPLRAFAASDRPMLGVCLGFQLFMDESEEFGTHKGLGLLSGSVRSLRDRVPEATKVPMVGWLPIEPAEQSWGGSLLDGVASGAYLYFVHSYYVKPADPEVSLATAEVAGFRYCCAAQSGKVMGCQFHPERSDTQGLAVYGNLRRAVESML